MCNAPQVNKPAATATASDTKTLLPVFGSTATATAPEVVPANTCPVPLIFFLASPNYLITVILPIHRYKSLTVCIILYICFLCKWIVYNYLCLPQLNCCSKQ